jgi:hypothetical protein
MVLAEAEERHCLHDHELVVAVGVLEGGRIEAWGCEHLSHCADVPLRCSQAVLPVKIDAECGEHLRRRNNGLGVLHLEGRGGQIGCGQGQCRAGTVGEQLSIPVDECLDYAASV